MSFTTISKEEWIQKIEKDLKGKPLNDLNWQIAPQVHMDPLVHADDRSPVIRIDKRKGPTNQIPITEIHEAEEKAANQLALAHLSQGAGAIIFRNFQRDEANHRLTQGIASDMVTQYFSPFTLKINLSKGAVYINESIASLSQAVLTDSWRDVHLIECVAGHSFYLNLCGLRALQIIIDQIKHDLSSDHTPKVVLWYPHNSDFDIAGNLLRSMPVFLAGYLANAYHLGVKSCEVDEERRLHMNNIHLLALEGHLPSLDAVSGSFYLDKLTKKLADRIWGSLVKEINTHE